MSSSQVRQLLFVSVLLLNGCNQSNEPPSDAGLDLPIPNETADPALAISFANNWLINPTLDDVENIKALLVEALTAQPAEVQKVLDQVLAKELVLKNELLFAFAISELQQKDFAEASKALTAYLTNPNASRASEARDLQSELILITPQNAYQELFKSLTNGTSPTQLVADMRANTGKEGTLLQDQLRLLHDARVKAELFAETPSIIDQDPIATRISNQDINPEWTRLLKEQSSLVAKDLTLLHRELSVVVFKISSASAITPVPQADTLYRSSDSEIDLPDLFKKVPADGSWRQALNRLFDKNAVLPMFVKSGIQNGIARNVKPNDWNFRNSPESVTPFIPPSLLESNFAYTSAERSEIAESLRTGEWDLICTFSKGKLDFDAAMIIKEIPGIGWQNMNTGAVSATLGELWVDSHDFRIREKEYIKPGETARLFHKTDSILRVVLPEAPLWFVLEDRINISVGSIDAQSEVEVLRVHVLPSSHQVAVDLYVPRTHQKSLKIAWRDEDDDLSPPVEAEFGLMYYELRKIQEVAINEVPEIISRTKRQHPNGNSDIGHDVMIVKYDFADPVVFSSGDEYGRELCLDIGGQGTYDSGDIDDRCISFDGKAWRSLNLHMPWRSLNLQRKTYKDCFSTTMFLKLKVDEELSIKKLDPYLRSFDGKVWAIVSEKAD